MPLRIISILSMVVLLGSFIISQIDYYGGSGNRTRQAFAYYYYSGIEDNWLYWWPIWQKSNAQDEAEDKMMPLDRFGIKEIYPTKDGREWYFSSDSNPNALGNFWNINNVQYVTKSTDDSWQVYDDHLRLEAWSPINEKWLNVEITEYAKVQSYKTNGMLQMYSRGGDHTNADLCLGSAYKARLYGDGTAAWTKELTHPAYTDNRGEKVVTGPLKGKWIGFKAVIYNFQEGNNTYVRLESYIDDNITDSKGNLVVKNNWKLASVVEDRGGWATDETDFDPDCGRDRGEILVGPGGTDTQNIAAWRTDYTMWNFKYLSVREIKVP